MNCLLSEITKTAGVIWRLGALVASLTSIVCVTVEAATYTVSNCADSGAGSLRQAVTSANANPGADVINFNLNCATITLQTAITVAADLTVQGPGASALTITSPNSRALDLMPEALPAFQQVEISGLRFAGGRADAGGAIFAFSTNLAVREVVFSNNDANVGGAIVFLSSNSAPRTLLIENSTFVANGNTATLSGGAVASYQALVTVRRSLFRQNGRALMSGAGGAIAASSGVLLVSESAFYANRAAYGGAIAADGSPTAVIGRVVNTSFIGNVATGIMSGGYGGGAIAVNRGELRMENATLNSNVVQGDGYGSALQLVGGSLELVNTTLAANRVESSQPQNASITALAVAPAGDNGGATASVVLQNTVATGSVALDAAKRHDVWVSHSQNGNDATLDLRFSLVSSQRLPSGATVTSPGDASLSGAADHGGVRPGANGASEATFTQLPLPGSPLINAGNTAAATLSTDQRGEGFARVLGPSVDIGAVEYPPEPVVVLSPVAVPALSQEGVELLAVSLLLVAGAIWRQRRVDNRRHF